LVIIRERSLKSPPSVPTWQTVFCSLSMIILTFFIMMTAWSQFEVEKLAYVRRAVAPAKKGIQEVQAEMEKMVQEQGKGGLMRIEKKKGGFTAILATPLLFATGKASLDSSVYPILDEVARITLNAAIFITVEGHTDNTPINTQEFPSNWELSALRAVNVIRYLHRKGLPLDRLSAVGFGESHPVAPNDTEEGRQKNRRIEIVFSEEAY